MVRRRPGSPARRCCERRARAAARRGPPSSRVAASMLLVRYSTWNGPGPRRARASAAGPGSAGCATVRPVGPEIEHGHVRLDDRAALDLRRGHPEHTAVRLDDRREVGHRDVHAVRRSAPFGMIPGLGHLTASLVARGQVLDEEDGKRVLRAERRRLPAELLPRRGSGGRRRWRRPRRRRAGASPPRRPPGRRSAPPRSGSRRRGEVFGQAGVRASGLDGRPVVRTPVTQAQELRGSRPRERRWRCGWPGPACDAAGERRWKPMRV